MALTLTSLPRVYFIDNIITSATFSRRLNAFEISSAQRWAT